MSKHLKKANNNIYDVTSLVRNDCFSSRTGASADYLLHDRKVTREKEEQSNS
jgi:hypothetical protein